MTLLKTALVLPGLAALLCAPPAEAQTVAPGQQRPPAAPPAPHSHLPRNEGEAEAPLSVSLMRRAVPPKGGKTPAPRPVGQQVLADAILGDALQELWLQSDRHFHNGEYNHAVNLFRVLVQGDPKNMEAFDNGAWLLWSMTRKSESVAFLEQGLRVNPDSHYLYDELGQHYLRNEKDPARALPYLEKAVKFRSPFSTWHALAHAYEKTNQWGKAVGAWERATTFKGNVVAEGRLKRARAELARRGSGR